jgi:hypothetical protein
MKAPWASIADAVEQLKPGDTLYLRGGTYYQSDITVSVKGSASSKITIASFPGERAEIFGGSDAFNSAPNSLWDLVDAEKHIYRSKAKISEDYAGWLTSADLLLWRYETYADFSASSSSGRYCGPGLIRKNGHIHIRLQQNANDLQTFSGAAIAPIPADLNPNHHAIRLVGGSTLMWLDDASYLVIKDIHFLAGAWNCFEIGSGSHHVEMTGCEVRFDQYGILIREGVHDVEISNCLINNGFPPWSRWGDIKNGDSPPLKGYNAMAVFIEGASNVHLHDNVWKKCFQNINMKGKNIRVMDNTFIRPHETFLISPTSTAEIGRNVIRHALEVFALAGDDDDGAVGEIFLHHNIVDQSALRYVERKGNFGDFERVWTTGWDLLGDHERNEACENSVYKIYNNTFIGGANPDKTGWHGEGTPLRSTFRRHVEYNNIYVTMGDVSLDPQVTDVAGNVLWRMRGGNATTEPLGLAVNPGFNAAAFSPESDDLKTSALRRLYTPTHPQVFTPGKSYRGLKWPGTEGVHYRGALPREP